MWSIGGLVPRGYGLSVICTWLLRQAKEILSVEVARWLRKWEYPICRIWGLIYIHLVGPRKHPLLQSAGPSVGLKIFLSRDKVLRHIVTPFYFLTTMKSQWILSRFDLNHKEREIWKIVFIKGRKGNVWCQRYLFGINFWLLCKMCCFSLDNGLATHNCTYPIK